MCYPVSTSMHLCFDNDYRVSAGEQGARIAKCGFQFLDYNFLDWQVDPRSPFLQDNWLDWVLKTGEAVEKAGAKFNQAHAPVHKSIACRTVATRDLQLRAIEACGRLGIPWLVFHTLDGVEDYTFDFNRDYFTTLLDACHKFNVGMAIENSWPIRSFCPLSKTEGLVQLVDYINDPLVGICWDTGHGNVVGKSRYGWRGDVQCAFEDAADQYAQLTKIGKRLKALHVNDNGGMDDDHLEPFAGTVNWNDVMRALRDIGYEHSFTFEAHNAVVHLPEALKNRKIALLHDIGEALVHWDEAHPFA